MTPVNDQAWVRCYNGLCTQSIVASDMKGERYLDGGNRVIPRIHRFCFIILQCLTCPFAFIMNQGLGSGSLDSTEDQSQSQKAHL